MKEAAQEMVHGKGMNCPLEGYRAIRDRSNRQQKVPRFNYTYELLNRPISFVFGPKLFRFLGVHHFMDSWAVLKLIVFVPTNNDNVNDTIIIN